MKGLVKGYDYDEFGQTKETGDALFKNDVKFTGAVHDQSSNLYYMNARLYNPKAGRFLTQDSYKGNAYEPWTQHLYVYTGNNPVNYVDPTGHARESVYDNNGGEDTTGQKIAKKVAKVTAPLVKMHIAVAQWKEDNKAKAYESEVKSAERSLALLGVEKNDPNYYEELQMQIERQQFAMNVAMGSVSPIVTGESFLAKAGEFSIIKWNGYPSNIPKPNGPFRILEGAEYDAARKAANQANQAIHNTNPSLKGMQIHEIHPVKFGGSPTDVANKIALPPSEHAKATTWWRQLQRSLEKK